MQANSGYHVLMQSLKRSLEIIVVVLVLGAFSVFAVQNNQPVWLHFLSFHSQELPVFMIILLSILFGCLLTLVVSISDVLRHRALARRLEKKLVHLEEQLVQIKQQPILDNFSARNLDDEPHDSAPTQPTLFSRTR